MKVDTIKRAKTSRETNRESFIKWQKSITRNLSDIVIVEGGIDYVNELLKKYKLEIKNLN